jgi:murein DD-endopeptidase MepM/ murein hydrolase activator NlpD
MARNGYRRPATALFTAVLVACIFGQRAQRASTLMYDPDRDGGARAMSRTFAIDDLLMSRVLPAGLMAHLRVGLASSLTVPGGEIGVHSTGGQQDYDDVPPAERARIEGIIAEYEKKKAGALRPASQTGPQSYTFHPQAGTLWQDLFMNNFVDLDPSAGAKDWDCSGYTYNGHMGHDSDIKSFQEQVIGVPIFAALDGTVVDAHDGEFDRNTAAGTQKANYVVLDHGDTHYSLYWHMKTNSVAVTKGQVVRAGTQLGQTGSSGSSTAPHLHFESRYNGKPYEPYAGPCRAGTSNWVQQQPIRRGVYVSDLILSNDPFEGAAAYPPYDEAARTGTFLQGQRTVYSRLTIRGLPAASNYRIRFRKPGGATALDSSSNFANGAFFRTAFYGFSYTLNLAEAGRWHLLVDINGQTVAEAPFDVVSSATEIVNRAPNPMTLNFEPAAPAPSDVIFCRVQTSLVAEDPDYDIVRYRYQWLVNGSEIRDVTSAALSDAIPHNSARDGEVITCTVTPSDGKASGVAATSTVRIGGTTESGSLQFSAAAYSADEGGGGAAVTVTRTGDASGTASINYQTTDTDTFTVGCADVAGAQGNAYGRCDFAVAVGTLVFAPGETSKLVTVPVIDDAHVEGSETFQLRLSNATGGALGFISTTTVTITDNDAAGAQNPVVSSFPFFVRQQYLDFLSREPDTVGFNAWLGLLDGCPNSFTAPNTPSGCDRIYVSGEGFFRSLEFQLKGFYVFRFYKVGFDRLPDYLEVVSDMSFVAGQTAEEVYARKAQLATLFTERQEFKTLYGGMTNAQYVNALLVRYQLTQVTTPDPTQPDGSAKVTLTAAELTNRLNANTLTRAQVLRAVADSDAIGTAEFNNAFVGMQYYGYLRRKPDTAGFNAWLNVLQSGDVRTMVNGFLNSTEYKLRFGQP